MGARAVGPWVGEQKPLGKSPLRGNPSPESTYLPTYSTYDQEILSGMVLLSSQLPPLASNPIVCLCDHEPVKYF